MGCRSREKPKIKCRKGLWSPEEDEKLRDYVLNHEYTCWTAVPIKAGLQRNGKSCRLRWINYLRPGLKRCPFTPSEENTLLTLHSKFGNKWARIAAHLPGRTDNEVKNHWNCHLKKRAQKGAAKPADPIDPHAISGSQEIESPSLASNGSTQTIANSSNQSSLPKIFFADWLSMELSVDPQRERSADSGEEITSFVDYIDNATLFGDAFAPDAHGVDIFFDNTLPPSSLLDANMMNTNYLGSGLHI